MANPASVSTPRVHAQLLLARSLVATSFIVGAMITHGLAPERLVLVRFALATLLFAPYVVWRHGWAMPSARQLAGYAAISASLVVFFWCMFEALRLTSSLNAAAIFTMMPCISALYAAVLVRERLGGPRLTALLPAMAEAATMQVRLLAATEIVLGFGLLTGIATQFLETGGALQFTHKTVPSLVAFAAIGILLLAH
mgnify:CR=1 FL=1